MKEAHNSRILFELPAEYPDTEKYLRKISEKFSRINGNKVFYKKLMNCTHQISSGTGYVFLSSTFFNGSELLITDYIVGRFSHYHIVECNIVSKNKKAAGKLEEDLREIFVEEISEYPR